MSNAYFDIAFTDAVLKAQEADGSRAHYADATFNPNDRLTDAEAQFIAARDGFYLATMNREGWPYIQYRGGPAGFARVLDDKTIGLADFRGNRQMITAGNLSENARVALFFMDYANRRRLKLFAHAAMISAKDDPALVRSLSVPGYKALPERALVMEVVAFNWNCPQHITPRFTAAEIAQVVDPLKARIAELEA